MLNLCTQLRPSVSSSNVMPEVQEYQVMRFKKKFSVSLHGMFGLLGFIVFLVLFFIF